MSIFSGVHRKGSWEPPEALSVFSLFGGVHLDYREADLLEGRSEIKVLSLFGGVQIVVPPDVHVETRGLGIFGNFSHLQQRAEEEDAPGLRVTGLALFGGVDVRCKRESWVKRRLRRR